jgi:hypothetical protein
MCTAKGINLKHALASCWCCCCLGARNHKEAVYKTGVDLLVCDEVGTWCMQAAKQLTDQHIQLRGQIAVTAARYCKAPGKYPCRRLAPTGKATAHEHSFTPGPLPTQYTCMEKQSLLHILPSYPGPQPEEHEGPADTCGGRAPCQAPYLAVRDAGAGGWGGQGTAGLSPMHAVLV